MKGARINLKSETTSSLRQSMNVRRHELTQKIRKEKKSHMLQLKRRHTSNVDGDVISCSSSTEEAPKDCFIEFISSPTFATLLALQSSLSRSKNQISIRLQDYPIQQAEQFLRIISGFLSPNDAITLEALKVLTNLSAMESSDSSTNYYTSHSSWCVFMLSPLHCDIPQSLTNILSSSNITNVEQACWVIGNIAGDSQQCREKLISMNILSVIVLLLRNTEHLVVLRNAIWALSNMSRGDHSLLPFIQAGLNSDVILNILRLNDSSGADPWVIRSEMAWLMAFISAKEETECITLLINTEIFIYLVRTFSQATDIVIEKRDRGSIFKSVIPLIRILGNLATLADGQYVPGIIETEDNSIVKSLAKWLRVHKPCPEVMTICTEVTWVCGALLCDVGRANHASTTVAYPILFPALCDVFLQGSFTLEWKREIINAMWNALASPPNFDGDTFAIRDELLLQLFQKDRMVGGLVGTLTCLDVDAIRPALNIIDAMHRRLHRFGVDAIRTLEEAECEHALEHVCEAASSCASYGSSKNWDVIEKATGGIEVCADIAANLIDDFYSREDESEYTEFSLSGPQHVSTTSEGNQFSFGLQGPSPTFVFSSSSTENEHKNTIRDPMTLPAGRGRGRGKSVPAWMQKQMM